MKKTDKIRLSISADASALREAIKQIKKEKSLSVSTRYGTAYLPLDRLKEIKEVLKLTLKSGATVEGTGEEIAALLAKGVEPAVSDLEDSLLFYRSDSKGTYMPISTMNIGHVRNAMLKLYREWAAELSELWGDELIEAIASGPADNKQFQGLYRAYISRHYSEGL